MIQQNINTPELISIIKNSIYNSLPLSIVRCGDGEMHMLKNPNDFIQKSHKLIYHRSMCINIHRDFNWKCAVHSNTIEKPKACECYLKVPRFLDWINNSKKIISYAIKYSDYVGLVVPGKNSNFYSISNDVIGRYGINTNKLKIISSLFPGEETFGSLNSFKSIIQGNDIHIITSNVDRFVKGDIDKLLGVNISYTDISKGRSIDPNIKTHVKESIKNTDKQIILFGGGYAIKDLIPWSSKKYGKISIDVGSVLDAWSGYQSRRMFLDSRFEYLNWIK